MKKWYLQREFLMLLVAAVVVTVSAILTDCPIYRIIPLYVSLVVMILQTRANRFCFLLGGINSAYYAVVYFILKLYGMAFYSLVISFPIQLITFFRWRNRAYGKATILRKLSTKQRILWVAGFGSGWLLLYGILSAFGSGYVILDNTVSVLSAAGNVMSMMSLVEFPFVQMATQVTNIILYIRMIPNEPGQWTYLLYSVYALTCAIISAYFMHKLYKQQNQKENGSW